MPRTIHDIFHHAPRSLRPAVAALLGVDITTLDAALAADATGHHASKLAELGTWISENVKDDRVRAGEHAVDTAIRLLSASERGHRAFAAALFHEIAEDFRKNGDMSIAALKAAGLILDRPPTNDMFQSVAEHIVARALDRFCRDLRSPDTTWSANRNTTEHVRAEENALRKMRGDRPAPLDTRRVVVLWECEDPDAEVWLTGRLHDHGFNHVIVVHRADEAVEACMEAKSAFIRVTGSVHGEVTHVRSKREHVPLEEWLVSVRASA